MNFRTHHVAFTVNNINESATWYKEKLGFKVVREYNKNGMQISLLELGNVRLELFDFDEKTNSLPDYRKDLIQDLHAVGTKHLCIEVDNVEEQVKKFKENGVEFITEIDTAGFGGKYIFFKDCSGILIELYQR